MKRLLFKKTYSRLAATYLLVVMAVSLLFSISIYRILSTAINSNYVRSMNYIDRLTVNGMRPDPWQKSLYLEDRALERERNLRRLKNELLAINLIIFFVGGILCYALAQRTLRPVEEAHEELERFMSDASHELRTPLTTMRTEIEVALMNKHLTVKDVRSLLQSNLEEVERLTKLSERLLTLSRLEEGDLPKENVNFIGAVQRAVDAVSATAELKRIRINESYPKNKKTISVLGDQTSLCELVIIMLDNAIKFSSPGSKVTVAITTDDAKHVKLQVIDEGQGIAPTDVPHIFERFYRADTSRTNGEHRGYGLGLALAKKIVDLHNGTIEVESNVGKGSEFCVSLPIR